MDTRLRFALIGCGAISRKHIASLQRIKDAELAAVCDLNIHAAKKLGDEHHVPFYSDYHQLARSEKVDVFSILSPSGSHASTVLDLAQYGKHFVVEKPLALRLDDADRMIEACDAAGVTLHVVQQNRFNLPITKLREALLSGRFGKMVSGSVRVRWCRPQEYYDQKSWRGTWAEDGGVLTNQASHHIDMLAWLMGDVESVMAMTATRLARIETEDTGVVILRFRNGALGVIEATTATRPRDVEGSISIMGEGGTVEIGGFFMNELKLWQFVEERPQDEMIRKDCTRNPNDFAWNHTEYLAETVQCIKNNRRVLVDGLQGRKSLELINAIYESAESGKEIFLRFKPRKCKLGIVPHE